MDFVCKFTGALNALPGVQPPPQPVAQIQQDPGTQAELLFRTVQHMHIICFHNPDQLPQTLSLYNK